MNDMYAHVTIRILEKEYQVSCPADEKAELMAAAELLNKNMREIRDSGKVVGLDRVAVMAALNMANELLTRTENEQELKEIVNFRVKAMSSQLDSALGQSAKQLSF